MSMITYPLNGVTYDAEDVSTYLCTRTSGVYSKESNFAVSVTGTRQITVAPGLAWINYDDFMGVSVCSRGENNLTIPDADNTLSRIDRVVLQFDTAANLTALKLKPGTPAAAPEPPAILQNHNQYELGICTVRVPAGSSVVTAADITDTRADEAVCGLMRDGVTGIPTAQLQTQAKAMLDSLQEEVDSKSFYTKAEADAEHAKLQEQISKAGGNVGQAIVVWSTFIDVPGYQNTYTVPDVKVPDDVDFLVLLERDTDLKYADDAQNVIIPRGQSTGANGYNYSFAQDGTLSLAKYDYPKVDFLYGFHYVTLKEGAMIPRIVKQGKVKYTNSWTDLSFTVSENTDYIVFQFIVYETVKVGDDSATLARPSSRIVPRGFTRTKDFTFANDGTVSMSSSLCSMYNGALYTCYHYMTSEELSAQTEALAAAQSAQSDTDALAVDQEYRLTLLELGLSE